MQIFIKSKLAYNKILCTVRWKHFSSMVWSPVFVFILLAIHLHHQSSFALFFSIPFGG